jgi:hypothetical protein
MSKLIESEGSMTQPEAMNRAIKLALRLECAGQTEAAVELRRLHKVNQELLAALKALVEADAPDYIKSSNS